MQAYLRWVGGSSNQAGSMHSARPVPSVLRAMLPTVFVWLLSKDISMSKQIPEPLVIELPHGFVAVPYTGVSLNGFYFEKCNHVRTGDDYSGPWALLSRGDGRALDDESGTRPYRYATLDECREAVDRVGLGEHSTCGGVVVGSTAPKTPNVPIEAGVIVRFSVRRSMWCTLRICRSGSSLVTNWRQYSRARARRSAFL